MNRAEQHPGTFSVALQGKLTLKLYGGCHNNSELSSLNTFIKRFGANIPIYIKSQPMTKRDPYLSEANLRLTASLHPLTFLIY